MKNDFYTQCRMKRINSETIAYVPSWAAVVGNEIKLLSLDKEFWRVISVGETISAEVMQDIERRNKDFQHSIK